MASGIIEYLAEGAWTKRMHAGWAAQSGLRAALMAQHGFRGPRTVFEGTHGLFYGFAHTTKGDYAALIGDFGGHWLAETLAFKPYPCGTMTHPYIDCARRLEARGIAAAEIAELICEVGEGTVHRLWEPLADKQRRPTVTGRNFRRLIASRRALYAAMWACRISPTRPWPSAAVLAVAAKVRYVVDPDNPYPKNFTGHVRAVMRDGTSSRSASRICAAARMNR